MPEGVAKEKLILASDGDQRHMILQFEGDLLGLLIDEFCYTPLEMELIPPGYGFWIWEGSIRVTQEDTSKEGDYAVFSTGDWRAPTDEEWGSISDQELVDSE